MSLVWPSRDSHRSQSVFPLAPTLGELAAKPTERVKFALSAPFRGTSPIGRGKTLICLQRERLSSFRPRRRSR